MSNALDPRLRDASSHSHAATGGGSYHHPLAPGTTLPSPGSSTSRQPALSPRYPAILQDGPSHPGAYSDPSPQSIIHTPARGSVDGRLDTVDDGEGDANDPKRPRACEACRGLKVRCEPDPHNPDAPCKRCTKAHRQCIITVPSRKRQKKTDSRVAELEKKIDALTASLHAQKSSPGHEPMRQPELQTRNAPYEQVTNGVYGASYNGPPDARANTNNWVTPPQRYPKPPEYDSGRISLPPVVMAGQKRKHSDSLENQVRPQSAFPSNLPRNSGENGFQPSTAHQDGVNKRKSQKPAIAEYTDVIDRGIITADVATEMFNSYVECMAPHMPVVVFPAGTSASEVRKSKPTLFLSILSASTGLKYPDLQRTLTKEVMKIYADRIICNGEKTLELIQALHVSTLWYWPPEHYEELKFYQLIHVAAVMAIDIGMGKKVKPQKTKPAALWRDHHWRRAPYPDPDLIETRRAWLGCYFLCCNASMGLRRPNLIRWNSYMTECIEILETSPDALESDKFLCQWVRSQRIAEDVGTQFSMDDPTANVSISDPKVQYALKGFERDLEKWKSNMPSNVRIPTLIMTGHVVNLYMHEVAMHVDHNIDEFKPPFTENSLRGQASKEPDSLTSAHIGALSICLDSIFGIFDTFLNLEVEVIRCLPIAHFVRVAYSVVVLIKMYFAAAAPNSELGKVINKDCMKVEHYLTGLVEVFRATASNGRSRPAAKFLMVLLMMKTWFHRQQDGKAPSSKADTILSLATANVKDSGSKEASPEAKANPQSIQSQTQTQQGQHQGYGQPGNSLQLLSEVATGNPGMQGRRESAANYSQSQGDWGQQQAQQNYGHYDQQMDQLAPIAQQGYGPQGMSIDPALGMDMNYAVGDGFEQAMGMALGHVDFDTYFSGDTFFGNFMDTVGGGPGNVFEVFNGN